VVGTIAVISYSTPIFITIIIPIALLYYFVQVRLEIAIHPNISEASSQTLFLFAAVLRGHISPAETFRFRFAVPDLLALQ